MKNNDKIIQSIMEALDELNEQLPEESRLEKSVDTPLFDTGGKLDSLGLVSLVTTIEQKIEENLGISTTLLEDIVDLESDNPFRTITTLADYVNFVLEKKQS
jgi:D-alanine--poly(phosphoribitol) ligase subunit 2